MQPEQIFKILLLFLIPFQKLITKHEIPDRCNLFLRPGPTTGYQSFFKNSFSVADPDPGSGVLNTLDLGWFFSGSRISDPESGPFFIKFSYIMFRILVMLSFLNWATRKTYSRNRKQISRKKGTGMFIFATTFLHRTYDPESGKKKFSDPG
jgi:hypothetical protein